MLHFFPKYSSDVEQTPFATELRRLGVPYRMFAETVDRQYKTRATLLLRVYPRLFRVALRQALASLRSPTPPDAVIVTSDVEAMVFGLARAMLRSRTLIVFETFIATPRANPTARRLHHAHYSMVLRFVDAAICHSKIEAEAYAKQFPGARTRFICLPYAMTVTGRERLCAEYGSQAAESDIIVTAGRSGRDYATLAKAVDGLPCHLRVICDWERPTQDVPASDRIAILRSCSGDAYMEELARARIVVIPLSHQDISAGQMVLLHAFGLRKPVVITDTSTTREYASDGVEALFVAPSDPADLRAKIALLLDDPALCARLGDNAARRFDAEFSTEAYVQKLVAALAELQAERRDTPRVLAPG